ncbi:MAG: hypothetical protein XXXJIFNMEKO3_02854 [Candidatus Erwinia impunctatus]|nr:hypothetical protein XXXJIFNMEKO_02854 [Culicoides impunctatus]
MSDISESPSSDALSLNDQSVSEYLLANPDYFIRNARVVESMLVPHPVRDSVSLVEWQMGRQRHQIRQLEEEVTHLMEQATANQILFGRLLQLQLHLSDASSLPDMLSRLHRWARDMGLAGAGIRLFSDKWRIGAPSDFTQLALSQQAFQSLRIQRFGRQQHYLGPLNGPELLLLLPQAKAIGSVALSLMGEEGDLGVLMFTSRDNQHYQSGMGTLLLEHLSRIIPDLVVRWVERI